jgi:aspartate-semialdehyde dehydrogenase
MQYNVAVVGIGAVGEQMVRVLLQRKFPVQNLKVLARSNRQVAVDGITYNVEETRPDSFAGVHFALFAGTEGEKGAAVTFAQDAKRHGAVIIDNGADFRMDPTVPLVVPEVNGDDLKNHKGIIANPNCSTIQMVVALNPIHKMSRIQRIIVSTYQAVSGTGRAAITELKEQAGQLLKGEAVTPKVYPYQIGFNVLPHIGSFAELDYTTEEWKMVKETHKIMHDDRIQIAATTVRVPVLNSHAESIYIETEKPLSPDQVREILRSAPGVKLLDDPKKNVYPMPIQTDGQDDTFVGRIRQDPFVANGLHLWCVADNIRKGAASNAVQIAEYLIKK